MIVVAFYTPLYEKHIKVLEQSCKDLGLDYYFKRYEDQGAWVLNCAIKPMFIKDCLAKFTQNILYVDADAIIRKVPRLNFVEEDMACFYQSDGQLLSGTLFFKNNDAAKKIVDTWCCQQVTQPNRWDQKVLQDVVKDIKVHKLPQGYTKIFDRKWEKGEDMTIYIEHFQASREMRGSKTVIRGYRTAVDGSIYIPRPDKELEKKLDAEYERVAGQLRWLPKQTSKYDLDSLMFSKVVHIVGKGPSLDNITANDFIDGGDIICINESIHKIEGLILDNKLFCLTQDVSLKDSCRPKRALLLVTNKAANWYADYEEKLIFQLNDLGGNSMLSVEAAIKIAQMHEATELILHCFDGCTTKLTGYANCIGHKPNGNPARFLEHSKLIAKAAKIPYSFRTAGQQSNGTSLQGKAQKAT